MTTLSRLPIQHLNIIKTKVKIKHIISHNTQAICQQKHSIQLLSQSPPTPHPKIYQTPNCQGVQHKAQISPERRAGWLAGGFIQRLMAEDKKLREALSVGSVNEQHWGYMNVVVQ